MDEKKRKWEKPVLEDIDGTLTYGICSIGSTYELIWCGQGWSPYVGCGGGIGVIWETPGCITGPTAGKSCQSGTQYS
jgi:hypothetical protein